MSKCFRATYNLAGRPPLPTQINEKVTYPPNTVHFGGWDTGIGISNNIVVDNERYDQVAFRMINTIEKESLAEFGRWIRKLEKMSDTDFALPQTRTRLKFCLYQLEGMFPESERLSEGYNREMERFAQEALDGSNHIIAWNYNDAIAVRDENERILAKQEQNMTDTIMMCIPIIPRLEDEWHRQDHIALTAMRWNGFRRVPDEPRRELARARANEIRGQINGINTAIDDLYRAIRVLQTDRKEADAFFRDNDQRLRNLDRKYEGKLRDIGNEIFNFKRRLEQMQRDVVNLNCGSVQNSPGFLRWIFENHRDTYLDLIEDEARNLVFNELYVMNEYGVRVLNAEALERLLSRPASEFTHVDFFGLAILVTDINSHSEMEAFLRILARETGVITDVLGTPVATKWELCPQIVGGILQFLYFDRSRQYNLVFNTDADISDERFLQLAQRVEFFELIDRLTNYERVRQAISMHGDERRHIRGPLLGAIGADSPFLTITQDPNNHNKLYIAISKEIRTYRAHDSEFWGVGESFTRELTNVRFGISELIRGADATDMAKDITWDTFRATLEPNFTSARVSAGLDILGNIPKPYVAGFATGASVIHSYVSEISRAEESQRNAYAFRDDTREAALLTDFQMGAVFISDDEGNHQMTVLPTRAAVVGVAKLNNLLEREGLTDCLKQYGIEEGEIDKYDLILNPANPRAVIYGAQDGSIDALLRTDLRRDFRDAATIEAKRNFSPNTE